MPRTRKKFTIVGNWKMNPDTAEEAKALFAAFERRAKKAKRASVVICPPFVFLPQAAKSSKLVSIGAQDVHASAKGAFTGSVSAAQAKSAGAEYALVGHSERRAAGDTDAIVAEKAVRALEAGLKIILCVGEKERDQHGRYLQVIREQVLAVLSKVDKKKVRSVIVAYEPVWAIGNKDNAALSPAGIHEMSIFIKKVVAETVGSAEGLKTEVLYGGSVNQDNAHGILSEGEIDGLLVGRQSLASDSFSAIIDYADAI
jgi:triosephosphate isomerase